MSGQLRIGFLESHTESHEEEKMGLIARDGHADFGVEPSPDSTLSRPGEIQKPPSWFRAF